MFVEPARVFNWNRCIRALQRSALLNHAQLPLHPAVDVFLMLELSRSLFRTSGHSRRFLAFMAVLWIWNAEPLPAQAVNSPPGGYSPAEAATRMTLPDGFHAEVFASEPDVRQPVAACFDERGRMWVIEYLQYPAMLHIGV